MNRNNLEGKGRAGSAFLLIDASCSTNLIALVVPDRQVRLTRTFPGREYPGENLLSACEAWLDGCAIKGEDLDYFATSHGPGSLTGLRVAGSFIRTLAQVFRKPVITLNSLWVLERSLGQEEREVVTIIQARQDRYFVRFRSAQDPDDYALLTGEELFERRPPEAFYCLEERCDLIRRFPDRFAGSDYVLQRLDPDCYIEGVAQAIQNRAGKEYHEISLHYGGQSVAEEVFYRKKGSMI